MIPTMYNISVTQNYSICSSKIVCLKEKAKLFIKIILFIQFSFFCIAYHWTEPLRIARGIFWTIWLIMAIIIIYKARKVKEELSVIAETWITICFIILILIFVFAFGNLVSSQWISVYGTIFSLVSLYHYSVTLYYFCMYYVWFSVQRHLSLIL